MFGQDFDNDVTMDSAKSLAKNITATIMNQSEDNQITNATVLSRDDFLYMELLGQGAFGKVRKCRPKDGNGQA